MSHSFVIYNFCAECRKFVPIRIVLPNDELCRTCASGHGFPAAQPRATVHHTNEAVSADRCFFTSRAILEGEAAVEHVKNISFLDSLTEPRGAYVLIDYQRVLATTMTHEEMLATYAHRTSLSSSIVGIVGTPFTSNVAPHRYL